MNSSTQVNRIFDYFAVCGYDSDRGPISSDYLEKQNVVKSPFEGSYAPQVLAHYPEKVPSCGFDSSAVTTLCMPEGVRFSCVSKESRDVTKDPLFHPFIITRENGTKVHGFSLIFHEEVSDTSVLDTIASLQKLHTAQVVEPLQGLPVIEKPSCNSKSLPRHFKVSKNSFNDQTKENTNPSIFDESEDLLLVSKCICLIGQYPHVEAAKNFLTNFYRFAVHSNEISAGQEESRDHSTSLALSPESYIHYLLFSIPLPTPNQCIVIPNVPAVTRRQSTSNVLILQRPSSFTELPLFEYDIGQVISLLGVDGLIQLWTCLLLESQVLIHSQDHGRLMLVAESLTTLLFPFMWPHVYVPILPAAMHSFLDAPVPYLMGLRLLSSDDSRIPSEVNICIVNIDNGSINVPEDLPCFPQHDELANELREVLTKLQRPPAKTNTSTTKQRQSWSPLVSTNSAAVLEKSEAYQRVAAIAKRTGVIFDDELSIDLKSAGSSSSSNHVNSDIERYLRVQIVNNAVREIFLNQFAHMFSVYEYFFQQPNQDVDSWLSNRDQVHPFDKTTFLSDQPGPHLPFLSRFLQSQMFATFIDSKVLANYGQYHHSVRVLDARIKLLRDGYGDSMVRTPGYEPCTCYVQTASLLERRILKPTLNDFSPSEVLTNAHERVASPSVSRQGNACPLYPLFPRLNAAVLHTAPNLQSNYGKKGERPRRKDKSMLQKSYSIGPESGGIVESAKEGGAGSVAASTVQMSARPAVIAQGNWKFVEQLLQECKTKTKRLLVGKMGSEAFELGHGQVSLSGIEDNTLIAGLCDLLERVWAHGLQTKHGKSALWSHIVHFYDLKMTSVENKPVKASSQTPDLSSSSFSEYDSANRVSMAADPKSGHPNRMQPLPQSLIFDMRNVQSMADVKTHLGYARAWVRLCLEKKLLYEHLSTLLSEENLLRKLYKRYGFLRCEEERNLFLTYLLTLNAADYHSFTNTYPQAVITYRVLIVNVRQSSISTCRPYLLLSGTLADTQPVYFSNDRFQVSFQHKNLGILTTLRIGMDNPNGNGNGRWLIDHIVVRNEFTGRVYKFPCSRWLGKDVEDGSSERLLVAATAPHDGHIFDDGVSSNHLLDHCSSSHNSSPAHGSRTRSPSASREGSLASSLTNLAGNLNLNLKSGTRRKATEPEIQCLLGEAVNNIIKFYLEPYSSSAAGGGVGVGGAGERGSVTPLLCGQFGLVPCLELVFHHGFRSSRIFSRNLFIWDFLLLVGDCCNQDPRSVTSVRDYADPLSDRPARRWLCDTIAKIQHFGQAFGKRDKLQLFLCLAARDRMLHRIISPLATCSFTLTHYDENSYLRNKRLRDYLQQLLQTLSEDKVKITLEASITRGVD